MKKILLLLLLSVCLLPAFSQSSGGDTEILTQINITRSADADYIDADVNDADPERLPFFPFWWPLYRWVISSGSNGHYYVDCYGLGVRLCLPIFDDFSFRGLPNETVEKTMEELVSESDERAGKEEFRGSVSRKIAAADGQSVFLFQMNWDYDPKNPRNGKAEIIISRTSNFGLK